MVGQTEFMSQNPSKTRQILYDKHSDLPHPLITLQQFYLNLKQDVKQPLEHLCVAQLHQQFEKIHPEITAYSRKDNVMQRKQVIVSAQKGCNFDIGQEKCMEKRNVLLELPELLSAITIKCAAQTAAKGTGLMFC